MPTTYVHVFAQGCKSTVTLPILKSTIAQKCNYFFICAITLITILLPSEAHTQQIRFEEQMRATLSMLPMHSSNQSSSHKCYGTKWWRHTPLVLVYAINYMNSLGNKSTCHALGCTRLCLVQLHIHMAVVMITQIARSSGAFASLVVWVSMCSYYLFPLR